MRGTCELDRARSRRLGARARDLARGGRALPRRARSSTCTSTRSSGSASSATTSDAGTARGLFGARFFGQVDFPRVREARDRRRDLGHHHQPAARAPRARRRVLRENLRELLATVRRACRRSSRWCATCAEYRAARARGQARRVHRRAGRQRARPRPRTRSTACPTGLLLRVTLVHLSSSQLRRDELAARAAATPGSADHGARLRRGA